MKNRELIYMILKAIDKSFEENNYHFSTTFNLEELGVSASKLKTILEDLVEIGYIKGAYYEPMNGLYSGLHKPYLSVEGLFFLDDFKN